MPQWWRVDLGAVRQLQQISIQFEHPERHYSYVIESSADDRVYTQQVTANGTGATQNLAFPAAASGRYVRITITAGTPGVVNGTQVPTWASFFELSLVGI